MGEDAQGKNFKLINGELLFVGGPRSYSIIGRMRWLSRIALASFINNRNKLDYKIVEESFPISISLPEGTLKLALLKFMFGIHNVKSRKTG
ncbi:hypothetical protein EYM_02210 [Ignicoccus islandicus DSM 13165]|uniref:Uncharacterized protein n=1 Tax=Ignicoccus islandicus DSM 13165 TaxID=940295 RepID=A0A0U3G1U4_9CREN|nr:hypothetical protein EYM_02210 [Ignicoccus islandicus DSM 13165]